MTATANKLSLAVPEAWITVSTGAEDADAQKDAYIEATGVSLVDAETMKQQLDYFDILASAKDANDKGYRENISVYAEPTTVACEPSEETMREVVGRNYGSPTDFKVQATSLGEASTMTYALANTNGVPAYGMLIAVPVPDTENEYAMINIATLDKDQTADLAQKVLSSVQVAA